MSLLNVDSRNEALSIAVMCSLLRVSRSSYYRHRNHVVVDKDEEVRTMLLQLAFEHLHYGYRRLTLGLRWLGHVVNHKRVLRLMRQEELVIKRRKATPATSAVKTLLGGALVDVTKGINLTHINQLWVVDSTYIRLNGKFVYLAIVLDRYSRKCVGWAMSRMHNANLMKTAMERAIRSRNPKAGLIHHSDQGAQYTKLSYVEYLKEAECDVSYSRPGTPGDNAFAESFFKTFKQELIYTINPPNYDELRYIIESYLGSYYNTKRMHSSLGYLSPEEFESQQINQDY